MGHNYLYFIIFYIYETYFVPTYSFLYTFIDIMLYITYINTYMYYVFYTLLKSYNF